MTNNMIFWVYFVLKKYFLFFGIEKKKSFKFLKLSYQSRLSHSFQGLDRSSRQLGKIRHTQDCHRSQIFQNPDHVLNWEFFIYSHAAVAFV